MELGCLAPEDFESLCGKRILVVHAGEVVECEVIDVRRLPPHAMRAGTPFAVTLRGPREPLLAQRIHRVVHPVHGPLELFVVPIRPAPDGPRYEITFN